MESRHYISYRVNGIADVVTASGIASILSDIDDCTEKDVLNQQMDKYRDCNLITLSLYFNGLGFSRQKREIRQVIDLGFADKPGVSGYYTVQKA